MKKRITTPDLPLMKSLVSVCLFIGLLLTSPLAANTLNEFNLEVNLTAFDADCGDSNNGAVTSTVSGGVPPYTYLWSNGAMAAGIVGLAPGTYSLTVTDNVGNTASASADVGQASSDIELYMAASYETCDGSCDANASVNVTGGVEPITYAWSSGGDFVVEDGLCAGNYTVTVTDANGCSAVGSIEVELSPEGIWLMTSGTDATCAGGNDGTAHVSVMTGVAPFTIVWSNGAMGEDITGLSAGTYTVTVTDANGCSATDSVTIGEGDSTLELFMAASYETCDGSCDANASVNVTGGVEPITYAWSSGGDFVVEDGLCAGNYTVTVTDANGCTAVGSIEVELSPEGIWLMTSGTDATCAGGNDGTAHVSVMTGVAPFTIVWSNGAMGEDITGLSAGTYTVTVTDANGCSATDSVTIGEGDSTLELFMAASYETCDGSCDANASVNVTGGVEPITYAWSSGGDFVVEDGLCAGNYTVTVTDANGCTAVGNIEVELSPEGIWLMTSGTDVTCGGGSDGTAHVSVMTGVAPFTIVWSNGAMGEDITGLSAGTYTVTVTDANGCSAEGSVDIGEPAAIILTTSATDAGCAGESDGTASVAITNGVGPYTIEWSTGASSAMISGLGAGTYGVTVTDANGCTAEGSATVGEPAAIELMISSSDISCAGEGDGVASVSITNGVAPYTISWSTGASSAMISGLGAGTYGVTVTDANGCTAEGSATVGEPAAIELMISSTDISCAGEGDGAASVSITNGVAPYTIDWSTGASSATISGLGAGTYGVTVTDASGCTAEGSASVGEPAAIILTTSATDASCAGGSDGTASVAITNGVAPFTINWSNGSTGATITGLSAGTYGVTVTDANGCTAEGSATVGEPAAIILTTSATDASCAGGMDGTASVAITNGVAPYTISWSTGLSSATISGLGAGTYGVTVTDANGCTAEGSATVGEPAAIILTTSATDASCAGGMNGTASVAITNGVAPLTINWSNGSTGTTISGLGAGTYGVTVTDANGCTASASATVEEPTAIQVTLSGSQNAQCGVNDGRIIINVSGGTPGYTYLWSNGSTTTNLDGVGAGTYSLTVTDANGCTQTFGPVTISEENCCDDAPVVESVVIIEAGCGLSDGSATILLVGNESDFTYSWSPDIGTANIIGNARTNLPAGLYSVTISSNDPNCPSTVESFTIGTSDGPSAEVLATTPATCNESNGTAVMSILSYEYEWCNGATGYNPTNLPAGMCQVTITDPATGCVDFRTVIIDEFNPLELNITVNNNPDCGQANGRLTANVSNGSADYSYVWSTGATSQTVSGLSAGTYCVTVTDNGSSGCVKETCIVLTDEVTGGAIITVTEPVNTNCIGSTDVTVDFDVTLEAGFAEPATTLIVDDQGNAVTNGSLGAGDYCIVVTDANGCFAGQACFEVGEPDQIDLDIAIFDNCDPTPSIFITEISGGTPPYNFDWSDLAGTNDPMNRTDLTVGTYSLIVTDANGCTVEVNDLNITEECIECIDPVVESVVIIEATCGNGDGSATISMVGSAANFTYAWSPNIGIANSTGNAQTALPAGIYSVTITPISPDGCLGIVETFTIGNADGPDTEVVSSTPATCNASDGSVEMSNQDYEYEWCNGATGYNPTNLPAGNCQVMITDPATGCVDYRTVIIEEVNPLEVNINVVTKPDCGQANGALSVSVTGDSGDFTYEWSTGVFDVDLTNLSAGIYCVTVTDLGFGGCTAEQCIVLTDDVPEALVTVTNPGRTNCVGGTDATVVFDVTYDAGFAQPATTIIIDLFSGDEVTNGSLGAGNYCIIITDANGCVAGSACFEVTEPEQIDLDIAVLNTCDPAPSISITEISGGTPSYNFDWSDLAGSNDPMDRTDLAVGTYSLVIMDANGCTVEVNNLDITEDCLECIDPIVESVVVIEATCGNSDGSATISMVGTEADFTYTWSPDAGTPNSNGNARTALPAGVYSVTITSTIPDDCPEIVETFTIGNADGPDTEVIASTPANCNASDGSVEMSNQDYEYEWCNGATGYNPMNLPAGMCQVTITDPATGCVDYRTVIIEQGNPLEVNIDVIAKPDCGDANGAISFSVLNDSGDFSFEWNTGATTPELTNLEAGIYCVTITDFGFGGCTAEQCIVLTENVPAALITVAEPVSVSCVGGTDGTVAFNVSYEIGFAQPASIFIIDIEDEDIFENGSLSPGSYFIVIIDANECVAGQASFEVIEPEQIDLDIAIYDTCDPTPGIEVTEISGGTPPYNYNWSDLTGTNNPMDRTDLAIGVYNLIVTDANGCSVDVNDLNITEECDVCIDPVIESVVIVEAGCDVSNGSATISMVGSAADFTYTWSPDIGTPNTDGNARTDLAPGAYSVTITPVLPDCPAIVETFTIGTADGVDTELISTTRATCNETNGTAVMSNIALDYLWCNGATGYNPTNLPAGECQVTITDPLTGCVDYRTVVIEEFNPLQVSVTINNEPDCGQANGSVSVNVTNGSTSYSYAWSNGATTQTVDNLASGSYCVTVTDNGPTGCEKEYCFVLNDNVPGADVTITDPGTTTCVGTADATVDYDIILGAGFAEPATVEIINADGDVIDNGNLSGGTYCIEVRDANGCLAGSTCFEVAEPEQIDLDVAINNLCDPTPGIEVTEVSGGTPPYTFNWADLPGADNPMDRPDLGTGNYDLTVTDSRGCSVSVTDLSVIDTCACPPLIISSVVVIESDCGEAIGQATVNIANEQDLDLVYQWSSNNVTVTNGGKSITNAEAGNYAVTITVANQSYCSLVEEFTIGNTDGPEASFTATSSPCGAADGTCTFSNSNFNYTWSDGGSGANRTDLAAGTYFVTISDPNDPGCIDVKTVVIEETASFTVSSNVLSLPDCGQANGAVTITPSIAGNYSFSWGGDGTVDNLSSGSYEITVTDDDTGCTATTFFTLNDNVPNASLSVEADAFVTCPGANDGTLNYSYTLPADFAEPASEEIQDLSGNVFVNGTLGEGRYCIIIKDANGCIAGSECIKIKAPDQIDVDVAVFNENCGNFGEVQLVEVLGGTGGYDYQWSLPVTSTSAVAPNLPAGQYTFTVTDGNGCTVSETVTVDVDPDELSVLTSPDTTLCDGSVVEISIEDSVGDIEWTNEAGEVQGNTATLSVSNPGTYYVSVDNGSCVKTDSVQVIDARVNVQAMTDNFACEGVSGQLLMIENLDPDDILTYDWSPDELIIGDENTGSPEFNTSNAGLYQLSVEITNQFGCSTVEDIEVLVVDSVDTPDQFTSTQCAGTTVDFDISGNGNFIWYFDANDPTALAVGQNVSYEYPIGGQYEVTVVIAPLVSCFDPDTITTLVDVADPPLSELGFDIDLAECFEGTASLVLTDTSSAILGDIVGWEWTTSTGQSSNQSIFEFDVNSSQDVEVNLVVTTENGCVDSVSQIIPVDILDAQIDDEAACFGQSQLLNESGDPELNYVWSPADLLDDPNSATPLATALGDTEFIVTVTNSQGCIDIDTVNLSVVDEIDLAISSEGPVYCSDEMVTLTASSGNATTYIWYDESGNAVSDEAAFAEAVPGGPSNPTTYIVEAVLNGCSSTDSITISNFGIDVQLEGPGNACPGDTVFFLPIFANDVEALNGATFSWSGAGIDDNTSQDEVMVITDGSGTYRLEVENEFCSGEGTLDLSVTDFSDAGAVADPDTIFLSEISNLSARGDESWSYQWSADPSILTDLDEPNLEVQPEETTDYMVTMTDSIGCVVNRTVTVVVVSECDEPFIFFPNAFSPNGDGFNDELLLRGNGVTEVYFAIYNRWGEKVFESNDQSIGWDGTFKGEELSSDVFGFYLRVRCGNGEEYYKQGNVSLFR